MAGVRHRLDLFGVLVLSFAAANIGGITALLSAGLALVTAGIRSDGKTGLTGQCSELDRDREIWCQLPSIRDHENR